MATFQPDSIISAMWRVVSFGGLVLVFDALVGIVLDQRISANSDDSDLLVGHMVLLINIKIDKLAYPMVRAITAFWTCRRFSASS